MVYYNYGTFSLFGSLGSGFYNIFSSSYALYGIYAFALFAFFYILILTLISKSEQFKGKPAVVIAMSFSIIAVGSIFYGKSPNSIILLFKGFLGFLLDLVLGIMLFVYGIYLSKKFKNSTHLRILFISIGTYFGSSLISSGIKTFFTNPNNSTIILYSLISTINEISIFTLIAVFGLYLLSLVPLSVNPLNKLLKSNSSPQQKNRNKAKELLELIQKESIKSEVYMGDLTKNLSDINSIINSKFRGQ